MGILVSMRVHAHMHTQTLLPTLKKKGRERKSMYNSSCEKYQEILAHCKLNEYMV